MVARTAIHGCSSLRALYHRGRPASRSRIPSLAASGNSPRGRAATGAESGRSAAGERPAASATTAAAAEPRARRRRPLTGSRASTFPSVCARWAAPDSSSCPERAACSRSGPAFAACSSPNSAGRRDGRGVERRHPKRDQPRTRLPAPLDPRLILRVLQLRDKTYKTCKHLLTPRAT